MTQPEALRLADELDALHVAAHHRAERQSAAELRRLHAQNKALQEQHRQAHENTATILGALTEISLLTPLGGEVAEYSDVVEAVRRLHAQRKALLEALKGILPYVYADANRDGVDFYKAELAADVAIKAAEGEKE